MAALKRIVSLYRRAGWPERLFAGLLLVYLLVRAAAPASTVRLLLEMLLVLAGIVVAVRFARRGIRKAVWRLRNRLVVAYLFIAVVPLALILLLAGNGCYLLTGQIAVYLVTSELEERTVGLIAAARELLATPPQDRQMHMQWQAQAMAERYPGVEFLVVDGQAWRFPPGSELSMPSGAAGAASGLIRRDGRTYMWAHTSEGGAVSFVLAPLSGEVLNRLVPGLGDVTLLQAGADQSRSGRVPPAANWLDVEVSWFRLIPVAAWENPARTEDIPLAVYSRPSAVLHTLFSERGDPFQGYLGLAFAAVTVAFLAFELAALVIGVSLTRTITAAVHGLYEGTNRVMRGDFSHRIEVRGNDQLADLGRSFNRMTENLERLLSVEKEKERLQSELEIAREVQNQLYPATVPTVEGLEVLAHCNPARTVSGDYYDYLNLAESQLALAVGDVAGKGISAALLMATVQSSLRTQIRTYLNEMASGGRVGNGAFSAAHLVSQLNQQLYTFTSTEKYATFYFGIYDSRSGLLRYTNAGHPPPIVVRGGQVLRLETNGMVVGAFPFAEYGESRIELQPGDLLACFTDGITEPENEYGEMFGEERLAELLVRNAWQRPPEILDAVYSAVRQWTASPEPQDDMTMLVARRT